MKILYIAPLPPPINGHSLAALVFLDAARAAHAVEVVNLSVGSRGDGTVSSRRTLEVCKALLQVLRKRRGADRIYFTISESFAGNLKDLAIYFLCAGRLRRMFIHLHGGSIRQELFDRHPILRWLNTLFIRRLQGVIVSGESHLDVFQGMVSRERLHIVGNFTQQRMFVPAEAVAAKFGQLRPLRVLFLSVMVELKGFSELADAYLSLDPRVRDRIQVDFAGRFEYEELRQQFLQKIAGVPGIRYHGMVDDAEKQRLFSAAHVFCLPTGYFEGQPISILEAYASGCVVLATCQSGGVRDIFKPGVNGFEIQKNSASIAAVLTELIAGADDLLRIASANRTLANAYTTANFNAQLGTLVEAPLRA